MEVDEFVIHIHPQAPDKPAVGAPCNGCGVCCLVAPCPLGMVLSGRRQGACLALRWSGERGLYQCGAVVAPHSVLHQVLPKPLSGLARWLAPVLPRMALRWIAAGVGCDSSVESRPWVSPTMPNSSRAIQIFPTAQTVKPDATDTRHLP